VAAPLVIEHLDVVEQRFLREGVAFEALALFVLDRREPTLIYHYVTAHSYLPPAEFATPNKLPREDFSGVLIDERIAEARGPLAQLSEVTRSGDLSQSGKPFDAKLLLIFRWSV
jgi:hypothetical protein